MSSTSRRVFWGPMGGKEWSGVAMARGPPRGCMALEARWLSTSSRWAGTRSVWWGTSWLGVKLVTIFPF